MKWFKLIAILFFPVVQLTAQWSMNTADNNPVSVGSEDQNSIVSVNSEDDGLIIAWRDGRNGGSNNFDIYAQKLDRLGFTQWSLNGVAICNALNSQQTPAIISDNSGGAIIVWDDGRELNNLDIYVQRIDALGNTIWTIDGVAICEATGVQRNPVLIPDGQNGAIIAWQDHRAGGSEIDIYAQRIDSNGVSQWSADGIPVCTVAGRQIMPEIVPDGAGGAIIVWQDQRVSGSSDIYAQRINQSGAIQWGSEGFPVCIAAYFQDSHDVFLTNTNEVLVTWVDFRNDQTLNNSDIYAQKISTSGTALWTSDGVPVCTNPGVQTSPVIINDETGGAIISWDDNRSTDLNVYAQRINNMGVELWTLDGIQITAISSSQDEPQIISDGQGGAIIAWEDFRDSNFDIYAQRIDPAGNTVWQLNGVAITTASAAQRYISIIGDMHGGAYLSWEDRRTGIDGDDVYAQQVNANGVIGVVTGINETKGLPVECSLKQNYPNPFNPSTNIEFSIPSSEFVQLTIYDVLGKEINTILSEYKRAGNYKIEFNAEQLPNGIYFYKLESSNFSETKKMILLK